jgi:hypothetical protein
MLRGSTRRRASRRLLVSTFALSLVMSLAVASPVAADTTPGDELSAPIPIPPEDVGTPQEYDTSGATVNPATDPTECDAGEFGVYAGPFTETVWHSFTPTETGELLVDVNSFPDPEADGFLAILFVFADDGSGGLVPVACSAFPATVQFTAEAATTYYAMTGSLPDTPGGGPALITIAEPVLTDLVVTSATYDPQTNALTVEGTVVCTQEVTFLDFSVNVVQQIGAHTVVGDGFGFMEACLGETSWSVEVIGFNSPLNPGRVDIHVSMFGCAVICSNLEADASVRALPTSNRPGPAEPPPPPPPDNDERDGAFTIGLGDTVEQDTTSATSGATDPSQCPFEPVTVFTGHTVWYTFTPEADGWVEVNTIGSDYDTSLFVLDGDAIVNCDDDIVLGFDVNSQLTLEAAAGTTYHIMVGAWQDSPPGNLVLSVLEGTEPPTPDPAPANDVRADAIPLAVGETLEADTQTATADFTTDPQECPDEGFPNSFAQGTVWYTITPDASGWIEVNTFDSDFDTMLFVLNGDDIVACNDNAGESAQSRVRFFGEDGVTYEVMAGASVFNPSPGGHLVISALESAEPFQITVELDPEGTVNTRTGEATIGFTVTCNQAGFFDVNADVFQTGGRFDAVGFGFGFESCGPDPTHLSITVPGDLTKFHVGTASVFAFVFAVSEETGEEANAVVEGEVTLRPIGPAG